MESKKICDVKGQEDRGNCQKDKEKTVMMTRKRLIEQALIKEKPNSRANSMSITKISDKILLDPSKALQQTSKHPAFSGPNTKKQGENSTKNPPAPEKVQRSKSPTCTKRNNSIDLTKNLPKSSKFPRGKSAERIKPSTQVQKIPKKPQETQADAIGKAASQFTIKKIQDLQNCQIKGNEELAKAFVAMMSDIEFQVKEPYNELDVFFDYISSPGIVIQSLRKMQMFIVNGKISESKNYIESVGNAHEIYSKIDTVTNSPGHMLLASLMDAIFKYKTLPAKAIKFVTVEDVKKDVPCFVGKEDVVETKISNLGKTHTKTESLNIQAISLITKEDSFSEPSQDKSHTEIMVASPISPIGLINPTPTQDPSTSFKDSKRILLDKFFSRMQNPESFHIETSSIDRSPLQSLTNKSFESSEPIPEPKGHISIKPPNRPSSTTPRLGPKTIAGKDFDKKIMADCRNKQGVKSKIEEFKRKNIMIGSLFYKKIDEKFIETLLEKMKKEPRDLKRLSYTNPEDYIKKKGIYIQNYKDIWVRETIKAIENSEFLNGNNENDSLGEMKHQAYLEYFGQEKTISQLVLRAEQLELASRKN